MFDSSHCVAVIPCFNESSSVGPLVSNLRNFLADVVVVDDGSNDATDKAARLAGARVIRCGQNRGKGAALKTGLTWARLHGYTWAAMLDGDGQHAPEDLPALFHCAQKTGAKLIIGDRMRGAHKMPWLRRHVNRWMSRQLSRRAGRDLPDTQSGFRLIHLPTWASLALSAERFQVESEMLLSFIEAGGRVEFVPVQAINSRRASHIRPVTDSWRWFKWWFGAKKQTACPDGKELPKPEVQTAG